MKSAKHKTRKFHAGHYAILGVNCACGGELRAESGLSEEVDIRWELYCDKCKTCDPNGYVTLRECVEAAKRWNK